MTLSAWLLTVLLGLWDEIWAAFQVWIDPWEVIEREMTEQERAWP